MHHHGRTRPIYFIGIGFIYLSQSLWTTFLLWQVLVTTHSAWWLAVASAAGVIPAVIIGLTGPDFDYGLGGSMASWLAVTGLFMGVMAPLIAHTPLGACPKIEGVVRRKIQQFLSGMPSIVSARVFFAEGSDLKGVRRGRVE